MFFFYDAMSFVVLSRAHQINAEAVDGRIILIDSAEDCYIVAHHPNKQWSYNVGWIDQGSVESLWDKANQLGHQTDKDKPLLYYEIIPVKLYEAYKTKHSFQDLTLTDDKAKKKSVPDEPKPDIIDLKKSSKQKESKAQSLHSGPKLAYPNEKPTYKYRSPGERNS